MKLGNKLKNRILRSIRMAALAGSVAMFSATAFAAVANDALPTNGKFMGDGHGGSILSANGVMTVNQQTNTAAVKWDTFNVGANATVNFNMNGRQDGHYTILNYSANGGKASEIFGRMKAGIDAHVWLVNPNGVLIGKGAQIDVGHMHMATHKLTDSELDAAAAANCQTINGSIMTGDNHTSAQLMSMGNLYVNSISFDGDRVVLDADKLFTYAGDKVELGENGTLGNDQMVHKVGGSGLVDRVYMGENGSLKDIGGDAVNNNTGDYAQAAADKAGNSWTGDALNGYSYLTIGKHAKEVVVGYTVYDEKANAAIAGEKGSYENSANWRALYTTLEGKSASERVGFAWVEDSKQLERIGEGTKTLARDFALKDGIAAIGTQEYNSGKGFQPIGADLTDPHSSHHTAFTGKFDGLTYDIYGLTINRPDENDIGLFGYVGDGAVIRNVNLVSGSIVGKDNVGGVVGHAVGNITLKNVVNSSLVLGVNNVGGIVGKAEGASAAAPVKIINTENVALVRGNTNVGGIGGNISNTTVTGDSYNTGAVRGIVNYQVADSGYKTKSAFDLTNAKYAVDGGYAVGSQVVYKVGSTEKVAFIKTVDSNGNATAYVNAAGADVTAEVKNATKTADIQVGTKIDYVDGSTNKVAYYTKKSDGTFTYVNENGDEANDAERTLINAVVTGTGTGTVHRLDTQYIMEARGSHDIGGIAGTANSVGIGNNDEKQQIYNGVEIQGGYNIGGIVGSLASDAGSASVVQNVYNKGKVLAKAFTTDAYYYQSNTSSGSDVKDYKNTQANSPETLNNHYYGYESIFDDGWANGRYIKKSIAVANAGGIVGVASGSNSKQTLVSHVTNYADVSSDTKTSDVGIKAITATELETTYALGGNVGGIVGKATSGTITKVNSNQRASVSSSGTPGVLIDYATNSENNVLGANNVGGILGYGLNSAVTNSVNNGGDVSMTGARNKDQQNKVVGRYGGSDDNMMDYGFSYEATRKTIVQNGQISLYLTGNAGGVMGYMLGNDSYIDNSRNRGYIHTQDMASNGIRRLTNEAVNVGGIVGKIDRSSTLSWNNASNMDFNADARTAVKSSSNEGVVSGFSGIGGIAGQMFNGEIMTSKNLGNIRTSFAQNAFNDQANMGGIVGDTPAGAGVSQSLIKIYDSFNEGVIGDTTFATYGRHVGGIVGRLRGEVSKTYNAGDMYTGSDNIGGIVGYQQIGTVQNVYNKGNITNYFNATSSGLKIGGVVGFIENGSLNTAYNLGVIRSYFDSNNINTTHGIGGVVGQGGTVRNVYSTGEILAANSSIVGGEKTWVKTSNGVSSIGGANLDNYRVILAEDPSLWSLSETTSNHYAIAYSDRYNISKYTTGNNALQNVLKEDTTDKVINRTDSKFRMYLYDKADGVSVTYGSTTDTVTKGGVTYTRVDGTADQYRNGSTTITVVGSMPILNKYVPYVYGGYDRNTAGYLGSKIGSGADDIKYIQVGTEYNPLQLNIVMNTAGKTLDVDYATAEMARAAHINVQNGNLNLHNINDADFFLAGIYVALNGNVTVAGSAERLNISSNTNLVGQNVNIINLNGSIENNATVTATAGNVKIQGQGITNYGSITALGKDDAPVVVKGVSTTSSSAYGTAGKSTAEVNALKAKIYDRNVQLNNKGVDVYSSTVAAPGSNGNIEFTTKIGDKVTGDVNLYLGNNKLGKISTEGNLTIVGDNVYSDSDYRMGYGAQASTKWIVNGNDIVLDFSNIASTVETSAITQDLIDAAWVGEEDVPKPHEGDEFTPAQREVLKRTMLHHMVSDFSKSNTKGNEIVFAGTNGASATNAMLLLDYFDANNVLNLNRYDTTTTKLFDSLNTLKVKNGGAAINGTTIGYASIANAEQLVGIQKAYTDASTTTDKAKVMGMNYALAKDIDASDITEFTSIGLNADGTSMAYNGTFDGRDHDLNSLRPSQEINGSHVLNNTGLFSVIGEQGTVKDLYINSSNLVGNATRVGLVAGTNKGTIDNVRTYGNTIKDADVQDEKPVFVGALVGLNDITGVIRNSISEDVVYAENEKGQSDVGGVAGVNLGVIYNSTGKSDVSVADGGATALGGVVGVNVGVLKDVDAYGVTAGLYEHAGEKFTGALNVGGIAGENRTVYETAAGIGYTAGIVDDKNWNVHYDIKDDDGNVIISYEHGGIISDAYNDSKVKGWSNTGGVIGKNFGVNDILQTREAHGEAIFNKVAGQAFYIGNAADVIAGENAGGLAGVNNGAIKGAGVDSFVATAANSVMEGSATADELRAFTDLVKEQVIYGRNAGKITAKSGMVEYVTKEDLVHKGYTAADVAKMTPEQVEAAIKEKTGVTTGTNVGGLIGISGPKADVDHLLNGKAASVYGKVNVGGLIGLNQGILQNSVNLMQNNDISGAINVGGIVGENTGIIANIVNTNKFNITINEDYVDPDTGNLSYKDPIDGTVKHTITYNGHNYDRASYFGGILGHNAAISTIEGLSAQTGGIVADVVNTANVTIEHPADYVGGIMGANDGLIGYHGMHYTDASGHVHTIEGYLRNDGAVGVINNSQRGNYVGGVIGQNNKNIYMVDITNSIKGTVYGYNYVGGIIGQNTAVVSGGRDGQQYANPSTAESGNYYKYDVYNNGMVTGTTNVGGLIGDNAKVDATHVGSIKLAYNTGVVRGQDSMHTTNNNIGGIVGSNEGVVDQVFNSTAPYNVKGTEIPVASRGVTGTNNVGGLVGTNAGAVSNAYNTGIVNGAVATTGSVIGSNTSTGTLTASYATDINKHLIGSNSNTTGLSNNFSLASGDTATGITVLSGGAEKKTTSYTGKLSASNWAFYNNASTPLLKNFLTKAYFVPNENFGDAFTYNSQKQGAGIKVEDGHINVYKVVNGSMTTTKIGEIFAADVNGDHSMVDYLQTRDANGDGTLGQALDGQQLIVGNQEGINADNYDLLYSAQINTYYNKRVVNSDGVPETVVNPNMLGYEFFEARIKDDVPYNPAKPIYDPSRPDMIEDPAHPGTSIPNPDKNPTDAVKPEDTNPKIPTETPGTNPKVTDFIETPDPDDHNKPKTPTYDINRVVLNFTASDVERIYGQLGLSNGTEYTTKIEGKGGLDTIVESEKTALLAALGTPTTPSKTSAAAGYDSGKGDRSLTNESGKTTQIVGDYTWTSTTTATEANVLANYTFDENMKNVFGYKNKDTKEEYTWKEKLGVNSDGKISTEGKATVTPAELVINLNSFDVTYGDAKTDNTNAQTYKGINQTTGGVTSAADAEKYYGATGVANGDSLSSIFTLKSVQNAAYNSSGKTNNVGEGTLAGGRYLLTADASNYTANSNYKVTIVDGSVGIDARVLNVNTTEINRNYGEDHYANTMAGYGVTVEGWAAGEENLVNSLTWNRTNDGGIDTSGFTTNLSERITNKAGNYTYTADINMKDTQGDWLSEGLKNYTFTAGTQKTSTVATNASNVNVANVSLKVNDINMIYGAKEGSASGTATFNNDYYYSGGMTVYTDNVKAAYGIDASFLKNGDSLDEVLSVDTSKFVNTGFYNDSDPAHMYGGVYKTKDVADGYSLSLQNGLGDVTKNTAQSGNSYNWTTLANGVANVKHALLTAEGEAIYRYYGEAQRYVRDSSSETGLRKYNPTNPEDYPIASHTVTGFAYGEESVASISYAGKTLNQLIHSQNNADGKVKDNALSDVGDEVTKNVGHYSWYEGHLSAEDHTMEDGKDLKNYRFWDYDHGTVTADADKTAIGASSYVLPQVITITLGSQTGANAVEYGSTEAQAMTGYAGATITGTLHDAGTSFVSGTDLTANNVNTNANLAGHYEYVKAYNQAFTAADKTNNVHDIDGNVVTYKDAIVLTGGTLTNNTLSFDPLGSSTYSSLATDTAGNYKVIVKNGDVELKQRTLKVNPVNGSVVYGDQNGAGVIINDPSLQDPGRVVAGDIVNLIKGDSVIDPTKYNKDSYGNVTTDNVGHYVGAIETGVHVDNKNYVLVEDTVKGNLDITRAQLTISLNEFKVLYGDTKDKDTINADYTRNEGRKISDEEMKIEASSDPLHGLTNGDKDLDKVFKLNTVNNTAFEDKGSGVEGTKDKGTGYVLYASGTDMKSETKTDGNVTGGVSHDGNYNVTIINGSVDVLAKKVIIDDPYNPTPEDQKNPDYVYVTGNTVERTYGNVNDKYVTNPDGTKTTVDYKVNVDGMAAWDGTNGSKSIAPSGTVIDQGTTSDTTTNSAGDHYKWNTNIAIGAIGTNYEFVSGTTNAEVKGNSIVNRAKLTIKLSDLLDANRINYGTNESTIVYTDATVKDSITVGSTEYTTTYAGTDGNGHGLAVQDGTKTYKDLVVYNDQNTGYVDGVGQKVTSDGTNRITYHHNAINATGKDGAAFSVTTATGDANFNNPVDNVGTIATGISNDGNYDVTIISGEVQFNKKSLSGNDPDTSKPYIKAGDVERTYGDTVIQKGDYTANIESGLVDWDKTKEHNLIVHPTSDQGLKDSSMSSNATSNVSDTYNWSGVINQELLPSWILDNYDLPATVTGGSKVNKADLVVNLTDHTIVYGTPEEWVSNRYGIKDYSGLAAQDIASDSTAEKTINQLLNGDSGIKYTNTGYDGGKTKDVGGNYNLQYNIAGTNLTGADATTNPNAVTGALTNYNVVINAGVVDIIQRHVGTYDPQDPNPNWPVDPSDPTKPWDPTSTDPSHDPTKPDSPFYPANDPNYDPGNQDDPRNQLLVQANAVERTYGDTDPTHTIIPGMIVDPSRKDKNGKDIYGVKVIYGDFDPAHTIELKVDYDKGLGDGGDLNSNRTNNAGDYHWYGSLVNLGDNYYSKDDVLGGSKVNRADLVIQLNGLENIVYGTAENIIKYPNPSDVKDAKDSAGTTYTGTYDGLAKQDKDAGLTVNDIVNIGGKNTGYDENGVGKNVYDANGKQIDYAYNAGNTSLANVKETDVSGTLLGEKVTEGLAANYNVTIVSGLANFQKRPVTPVDPQNPGNVPTIPNPEYDPQNPKPGVPERIPYDPFDPTLNPNNPNYNPDDPRLPQNDPKYDPTDPTDPRNQMFVTGNTVERFEGNTNIVDSKDPNGNPDGKKDYGIGNIAGLPSWIDPAKLDVTKPTADPKPADKDGGLTADPLTGQLSTSPIGDYTWKGGLVMPEEFVANFIVPQDVVLGNSIVKPLPANPVEDFYPWLHNTNGDHGWGHQEHWRERKAEVKFTIGGADFFNDLAKAEAEDDEENKES